MEYILKYHKAADKELSKLPPTLQLEIIKLIRELAHNPKPKGYKKLKGYKSLRTPGKECFRIRLKNYRIIYTLEEAIITIEIIKIAHRREVYNQ
ncbi:MAG: type II toxin-antitoxin system RelE/ParE family toxin [Bacteroidetes bacterium]|nr:type II toxin-antitoxin system RelE/ParE family toxin [Bacteroidota bacterium]